MKPHRWRSASHHCIATEEGNVQAFTVTAVSTPGCTSVFEGSCCCCCCCTRHASKLFVRPSLSRLRPMNTMRFCRLSLGPQGATSPSLLQVICKSMCTPWKTYLGCVCGGGGHEKICQLKTYLSGWVGGGDGTRQHASWHVACHAALLLT